MSLPLKINKMLANKKIAFVYDRVNTPFGGAEKVLLALKKLYPQADLFTAVYNPRKAKWASVFTIKTSFLQKIPIAKHYHRLLAPFMPLAFEALDLKDYDIIISMTSAEAKGIITRSDQLHFCYLLTPPRYLYHYQENYWKKTAILNWPIIKHLSKKALQYLKKWDQLAIHRPDIIVPISQTVARRINKYYHLESSPVIYPPVDYDSFQPLLAANRKTIYQKNQYYLLVSRLVPYKNIDLAIKACIRLGRQLIIVGNGPDYHRLQKLSKKLLAEKSNKLANSKQIIFQKQVNTEQLSQLYGHAQALLMPGIDDFGIVALEANLHSLPVLIHQHAGASEILADGQQAIHLDFPEIMLDEQSEIYVEELCKKMKILEETNFDLEILAKNAIKYDTTSFLRKFNRQLEATYRKKFNE
jgi:glycosyltransferase involved in cell wall biosynthesis